MQTVTTKLFKNGQRQRGDHHTQAQNVDIIDRSRQSG